MTSRDPLLPTLPPAASRSVVAARFALLLFASAAMVLGWAVWLRDGGGGGGHYVCPMHPEVVTDAPGSCPICGMALEPRSSLAAPHGAMTSMDADVEAVDNVRKHNVIDFVRRRSLLPHNRDMRGAAWVDADGTIVATFYKDQIDALLPDETGTFSLGRSPDVVLSVRRTHDVPEAWDGSTARIRFRADSQAAANEAVMKARDVGWVELSRKARDVLAVPASAVLQSPDGPYVLAWTGTGYQFEKRSIEIGETFTKYGFAVVLSGLRANERVVSKAAFFLDAERRLANRATEGAP